MEIPRRISLLSLSLSLSLTVSLILALTSSIGFAEPAKSPASLVVVQGETVTLRAPTFEFVLSSADRLLAISSKFRLTGRTLSLGNGPEVEFDIGLPGQPVVTPRLSVNRRSRISIETAYGPAWPLAAARPVAALRHLAARGNLRRLDARPRCTARAAVG
jgi:hypothetical protein